MSELFCSSAFECSFPVKIQFQVKRPMQRLTNVSEFRSRHNRVITEKALPAPVVFKSFIILPFYKGTKWVKISISKRAFARFSHVACLDQGVIPGSLEVAAITHCDQKCPETGKPNNIPWKYHLPQPKVSGNRKRQCRQCRQCRQLR